MLLVSASYSQGNNSGIYQEQAKNNKGQRKKEIQIFVLNEVWAAWAVSGLRPRFQFFSATLLYIPVTIMINNSTGSQQR